MRTGTFKLIIGVLVAVILFAQCKQDYYPDIPDSSKKLLVVEGFLNGGVGPTTIRLSRTTALNDTAQKRVETGAQVTVEGENGGSMVLAGNSSGEYSISQLTLNPNIKYRLRIKTKDGKEYASDFVPVKHTPAIDSVSWQRESDGVRIYVSTHDPQNATIYYQWEFDETWEFRSTYQSTVRYIRDNTNRVTAVVWRYPDHSFDTTIYKCWKTIGSTSIIIGSSEKLATDVIYQPVHFIEQDAEKLNVLYSINLKQYAVSHDKYLFLQKMKKNTEQMGTLFDPQPSQITGNIHNVSDPNEIVIGFVEITEEKTQRIFISTSEVGPWNFREDCRQASILNNLDTIALTATDLIPTTVDMTDLSGLNIARFFATNSLRCVDCRVGGRTNQRPPFWR